MKNNKGFYSWIHSLNEAAIQSHMKGIKMLNEEKSGPHFLFSKYRPETKDDLAALQDAIAQLKREGTTRETIELADGDPDVYAEILAKKQGYDDSLKPDLAPPETDLDGDGDVDGNDVEVRDSGVPNYPLAAGARLAAGQDLPGDVELVKKNFKSRSRQERIDRRNLEADIQADDAALMDDLLRYGNVKENVQIDEYIQRLIKTAPAGKIYTINELREIANNLKKKNIKNLNERTGQSWRERNPEQYARNIAAQQELENKRAENRRRRQEDEAYQFNQEVSAGSQGQGPTPSGGNLADTLEMGRDGNPNLPADTPENRARMAQWRRQKAETKQADYMAARMKELSAKDPNELTSSEAGELSLFKSMMSGKNASTGLESRVRDRFTGAPGQQGPTQTGGNLSQEDANWVFSQTVGRSQEDLVSQTQRAGAKEAEQKAKEQREFDAKQAEQRRAAMQNTRIQGTNMTYGEFETLTNRPYNALSKEDSDLVKKLASNRAAIRYTPAGREAALTADQMNQYYATQNAELARKEGEADRRVNQAQFELDAFNADRAGTVQREISNIQSQPGFVERVAQSMSRSVEKAKNKEPNKASTTPTPKPTSEYMPYAEREGSMGTYLPKLPPSGKELYVSYDDLKK